MVRILPLLLLTACPRSTPPTAAPAASEAVWTVRAGDHMQPEPLGALMQQNFDVRLLVHGVWTADHVHLVMGARAEDGTQDPCSPTGTIDADVVDGAFEATGVTIPFLTDGIQGRLTHATVRGTLDGTPVITHISGSFDTRPVSVLAGDEPTAACELLDKLVTCRACPEGDSDTCWSLTLSDVVLVPADGQVTPIGMLPADCEP